MLMHQSMFANIVHDLDKDGEAYSAVLRAQKRLERSGTEIEYSEEDYINMLKYQRIIDTYKCAEGIGLEETDRIFHMETLGSLVTRTGTRKNVKFLLFNDVLMYGWARKIRASFELSDSGLEEVQDKLLRDYRIGFVNTSMACIIEFRHRRDRHMWFAKMEQLICKARVLKYNSAQPVAGLYTLARLKNRCAVCSKNIGGFFLKSYNCYKCKQLVCASCAKSKIRFVDTKKGEHKLPATHDRMMRTITVEAVCGTKIPAEPPITLCTFQRVFSLVCSTYLLPPGLSQTYCSSPKHAGNTKEVARGASLSSNSPSANGEGSPFISLRSVLYTPSTSIKTLCKEESESPKASRRLICSKSRRRRREGRVEKEGGLWQHKHRRAVSSSPVRRKGPSSPSTRSKCRLCSKCAERLRAVPLEARGDCNAASPATCEGEGLSDLKRSVDGGHLNNPFTSSYTSHSLSSPSSGKQRQKKKLSLTKGLLRAEQDYVALMLKTVKVVVRPTMLRAKDLAVQADPEVLDLMDLIEQISIVNFEFMKDLQSKVEHWKDDEAIGELMLQLGPMGEVYVKYFQCYTRAFMLLEDKKWRFWFNRCRLSLGSPLQSFLSIPKRRLEQYKAAAKGMLQATSPVHFDHRYLQEALDCMEDVLGNLPPIKKMVLSSTNSYTEREEPESAMESACSQVSEYRSYSRPLPYVLRHGDSKYDLKLNATANNPLASTTSSVFKSNNIKVASCDTTSSTILASTENTDDKATNSGNVGDVSCLAVTASNEGGKDNDGDDDSKGITSSVLQNEVMDRGAENKPNSGCSADIPAIDTELSPKQTKAMEEKGDSDEKGPSRATHGTGGNGMHGARLACNKRNCHRENGHAMTCSAAYTNPLKDAEGNQISERTVQTPEIRRKRINTAQRHKRSKSSGHKVIASGTRVKDLISWFTKASLLSLVESPQNIEGKHNVKR
mmetsp:Transcript_31441/g.53188  ORF Transcript_31441/g.53188 Transcript_31441/m.53188 type:complete len:951 (+) Transcript_31441:259-3111(+)